jgi:hypothetical protein
MESNRSFFRRREAEELRAAEHCQGTAREAHEEMARRYRERLEQQAPEEASADSPSAGAVPGVVES